MSASDEIRLGEKFKTEMVEKHAKRIALIGERSAGHVPDDPHDWWDALEDTDRDYWRAVVESVLGIKRPRCCDCHVATDAGPCPGCGIVVCQNCAEREGEFCCDGAVAP